jgi:hypothetical protein
VEKSDNIRSSAVNQKHDLHTLMTITNVVLLFTTCEWVTSRKLVFVERKELTTFLSAIFAESAKISQPWELGCNEKLMFVLVLAEPLAWNERQKKDINQD